MLFGNAGSGIDLTPAGWADIFQAKLLNFGVSGAEGKLLRGEGNLEFTLGFIQIADPQTGQKAPLRLTGALGYHSNGAFDVDLRPSGPAGDQPIDLGSIPGFKQVQWKRLTTDFKSLEVHLLLFPEPALAEALPFLSASQPIETTARINLGPNPGAVITFQLPAEQHTNLFGKWPLTIQGMQFEFTAAKQTLLIRGYLNLGLPGATGIGAELVLTRESAGNDWSLSVQLHEIDLSLNLGGFTIEGRLHWGKPDSLPDENPDNPPAPDKLPSNQLGTGKDRDFRGSFRLKGGRIIGDSIVLIKIGSVGEMSYWAGGFSTSSSVPFGIGKLKQPSFVLAHNADRGGKLQKSLGDVTTTVLTSELRIDPNADSKTRWGWLEGWGPSNSIGTVFAASGFVELHSFAAAAPPPDQPDKLSALAITSHGLLRVEAKSLLIKNIPFDYALAVDFPKATMTASLTLPKLAFPPYEVSGGMLVVGIGIRKPDPSNPKRLILNPYLDLGLGWPELLPGSDIERDWKKSVMVHWDGAFPLNTFWGGFRIKLETNPFYLFMGFALRAGWTFSKSLDFIIGKGSIEAGLAVGGVVGMTISADSELLATLHVPPGEPLGLRTAQLPPPPASSPVATSESREFSAIFAGGMFTAQSSVICAAAAVVETNAHITGLTFGLACTIYADVWGRASAEILGVRIASISIEARARLHVAGQVGEGGMRITSCKAIFGIKAKVQILCFEYEGEAELPIVLVDNPDALDQVPDMRLPALI
jgi:hypothetical protein